MTKHVNTILSSRLVSIERQCWLNAQYSRRKCLDIVRIPSEVEADALEEKVVAIFEKLGCNILTERIEACHRISKKNPTVIVKFSHVKRDLRKIKMEDIELPGQNKLFINNKNFLPLKVIDIQYLQECINFEMKIGEKLCNFIVLYRSPSQSQDEFETFLNNIDLNLDTILANNPFFLTVVLGDFTA